MVGVVVCHLTSRSARTSTIQRPRNVTEEGVAVAELVLPSICARTPTPPPQLLSMTTTLGTERVAGVTIAVFSSMSRVTPATPRGMGKWTGWEDRCAR